MVRLSSKVNLTSLGVSGRSTANEGNAKRSESRDRRNDSGSDREQPESMSATEVVISYVTDLLMRPSQSQYAKPSRESHFFSKSRHASP